MISTVIVLACTIERFIEWIMSSPADIVAIYGIDIHSIVQSAYPLAGFGDGRNNVP